MNKLTLQKFLNEFEMNNDYVCVAYRYGHRQRESYVVDICGGIDTAKEIAEKEVNERGGKYSVVVYGKNNSRNELEEVYEAKCPEHYTDATNPIIQDEMTIRTMNIIVQTKTCIFYGSSIYWTSDKMPTKEQYENIKKAVATDLGIDASEFKIMSAQLFDQI